MKDFKEVVIFVVVSFVVPTIVISSGGLVYQLVGLGIIGAVLFYVHALDSTGTALRS